MPHKTRILIVDDNQSCCDLLVTALTDASYSAMSVNDAERAYEVADDFKPDLTLLDINMPGIDGVDLMMLLKGYTEIRNQPVVFISALPAEKMERKCIELGAVG